MGRTIVLFGAECRRDFTNKLASSRPNSAPVALRPAHRPHENCLISFGIKLLHFLLLLVPRIRLRKWAHKISFYRQVPVLRSISFYAENGCLKQFYAKELSDFQFGLWRCHAMAGGRLWATMKACFRSRQNVCRQGEQSSRHKPNIFLF